MRIGFRCDASASTGVGHLVRCLALAEQLLNQGDEVTFFGEVGEWASAQLSARGLPRHPAPAEPTAFAAIAVSRRLDAVVLDSYDVDPATAGLLRQSGIVAMAIIDDDPRGQDCDLYLDQNFGATTAAPPGSSAPMLVGAEYALLRSSIVVARPPVPPTIVDVERHRIVAFFGGTDAFGAAPLLTRLTLATEQPVDLTVVAGRPELADEIAATTTGPNQRVRVVGAVDDLPSLVSGADLVVAAAGSSIWELCCLGLPAAVIWVAQNQRASYERVVASGLVAGLGRLADLSSQATQLAVTAQLRELLLSAPRRSALATTAWAAIDGQGRVRVAEALHALVR